MAALDLVGVRKQFGSADVIRGVDLAVRDGEFMVFVGPSGCGKSTLLRLVAGLDQPTEGDIRLGGRSIVDLHPADRGVAMVFQSYALYPSMTVAENIGFALKVSGMPAQERLGRVQEVAQMLRLEPLLDRLPRQLSGGQRQRVAIGRAIVRQPELFLFDEPLSNLDAELRTSTRVELAALHRRLGTTMVYVTHDQVEAMTLGDRIAVFNQGRIEQVGAPMDLYLKPATEFVAGFIGSPRMNLLDADALRQWLAKTPAGADAPWARGLHLPARTRRVGIRPDHVRLADGTDGLPARMIHVERLGDCCILHLRVEGLSDALVAKVGPQLPPAVAGEPEVCVSFDPEGLHAFDETGRRIDAAA